MLSTSNKRQSSHNLDLSAIWAKAVEAGQLASEFNAPHDDPEGRWRRRNKILLGLTRSTKGFCYFAKNLSTEQVIKAAFAEKGISGTEFRCQLNGYRGLRPGGNVLTHGRQPEISPHSIECRFYCQDPTNTLSLLRRTPLAQIKLKHHLWNAYYNAVPLEREGHFIWTPVQIAGKQLTLPHYLQTLERAVIEDLFLLHDKTANFALLFNSLHAGASVNHLHVHSVYRKHPLAIEKQQATACEGFQVLDAYPAAGFMFQGIQSVAQVTEYVMKLQQKGIPFNLIWTDERVFLIPRNIEHEVTQEFPFDALSAMDMCGEIVTTDRMTYDSISTERIEAALRKSTIAASEFLRDWKAR
jgi:hypothetical protein